MWMKRETRSPVGVVSGQDVHSEETSDNQDEPVTTKKARRKQYFE